MKKIKNFCIISHIDHGKSTLADRLLEITKTIPSKKMREQFLDMMDLEREKGITIKMQPVRIEYNGYILNLIDTPGHVDFSYEVSRSLAVVEGAVLLVDASKGIQAQTLANLELAQKQNLVIIPVINKIDLAQARIEETTQELSQILNIDKSEIIHISAKKGTNVEKVLEAIIEKIPEPKITSEDKIFRAVIFDSVYNAFKGIVAYVRVIDGEIKPGQKIKLLAAKAKGEAKEVGFFTPEFSPQKKLSSNEIGYIATGIKEPGKIKVGDTITLEAIEVRPLSGYQEPKPMVFASLYPENSDDFDILKEALAKLQLNDSSLVYELETKEALGRGFRCGFLGTLHTEIISERLRREFNLNLIISAPSVVYKIIEPVRGKSSKEDRADSLRNSASNGLDDKNKEKLIYSASDWPDSSFIKEAQEPWVFLEIITPNRYIGSLSDILKNLRGDYKNTKYLGSDRIILEYEIPLSDVIVNLYDKIKTATQGYGSMNYKFIGYRKGEMAKIEVLVAGQKHEAFSKIVAKSQAEKQARSLALKIRDSLPSQQFSVPIQVVIGGKIIARETKKAQRKDVTAPLYGGDYTRKRKLLEKQKKGKKKLAEKTSVSIPSKVFLDVFKS